MAQFHSIMRHPAGKPRVGTRGYGNAALRARGVEVLYAKCWNRRITAAPRGDRAIGIALSQEAGAVDVKGRSTSFKIRGRELRVDFLTPRFDPESDEAPLLDFLIEGPAQAVVVGGTGVLVNVPDPARFAFHKLWVSTRRSVSEQTKAAKDLRQGGDLLEVLLADRPGDVDRAWEALLARPAAKAIRQAIRRLSSELGETLASRLP